MAIPSINARNMVCIDVFGVSHECVRDTDLG